MKEHCPVSRASAAVSAGTAGRGWREREGRLVNYGAIWHRFGFRQLAGVVAVEKTTGRPPVGYHASSTSSSCDYARKDVGPVKLKPRQPPPSRLAYNVLNDTFEVTLTQRCLPVIWQLLLVFLLVKPRTGRFEHCMCLLGGGRGRAGARRKRGVPAL